MREAILKPQTVSTPHTPAAVTGHVLEIFSSWQGEGIYHDVQQVFVRLSGCNQACRYCDTKESWKRAAQFRAETHPFRRDWILHDNPCRPDVVEEIVRRHFERERGYHSISLTGGEPLDQPEFLAHLLTRLRRFGLPIFLETAGTEPEALAKVLPGVDIVSADVKLPSTPGVRTDWGRIESFLRAAQAKDLYAKIVVWRGVSEEDLLRARDVVAAVSPAIPVILQPVTPEAGLVPPDAADLARWRAAFEERLKRVEVIPQLHKQRGHL